MISSEIGVGVVLPTGVEEHVRYIRQLAAFRYSHVYFTPRVFALAEDELVRLARLCSQYGVVPFAAHTPRRFLPNDEAGLDRVIEEHKQALDKAAKLGCHSVTYHVGSVEGVKDEDRFQETFSFIDRTGMSRFHEMNVHVLRQLAIHARRNGMMIAVENLPRDHVANYCRTIDDLKRIINGAGEANVGICIDTGHANISGLSSAAMVLEAGELLIETHFHDNFGRLCNVNAINDLHRPVGIGTVDWLQVIDALDKVGYEKPIIFELLVKGKDDLDTMLRLTRDNWQAMVQAWQYVKGRLSEI